MDLRAVDIGGGSALGLPPASPVVNLLASPTAINGAAWGSTTAGAVLTASTFRAKRLDGAQFGQAYNASNSPNLVLLKNHRYLSVIRGSALSAVPDTQATRYPMLSVYMAFASGQYPTSMDFDSGTARGDALTFFPQPTDHCSTFFAGANSVAAGVYVVKDIALQTVGSMFDIEFVGLYDITGLSGWIYDAANGRRFLIDEINVIGDSFSKALWPTKNRMGWAALNLNGSRYITGDVVSGSSTITNLSDIEDIAVDWEVCGNGIPINALVASIDTGARSITLKDANTSAAVTATMSITGSVVRVGYYGGGRTSPQVRQAWDATCARAAGARKLKKSLIWCGHNNIPSAGNRSVDDAMDDLISIASSLQADFRLLTLCYNSGWINPRTADAGYIDALNARMLSYFGSKCIDIRPALAAAANTTPADLLDMRWRSTPASLRADNIHLRYGGMQIVADAIHAALGSDWA